MKEYKLLISQYRSNSLLLTLCKIPWNLTSGPCRIRGPMHGHPYNSISVPLVIPPPPISLDQKKTFYQLLGHFKALAKGGKCTERSFGSYHNQVRGGGIALKNVRGGGPRPEVQVDPFRKSISVHKGERRASVWWG